MRMHPTESRCGDGVTYYWVGNRCVGRIQENNGLCAVYTANGRLPFYTGRSREVARWKLRAHVLAQLDSNQQTED